MSDDNPNKNPVEDHGQHNEIDDVSGVETTGHSWDGLKELNNPLPRWWVWVFIVTILWSIWYFVIYPSWPVPGGATEGTSGYTQYKELSESQAEIVKRQSAYLERFSGASLQDIMNDPELYTFAIAGGASAFKDNCATCHGTGAQGGLGYPNLNDDDWIWGGKLGEIHQTLEYGIRANNLDTRMSQMPAFGKDGLLAREEINAVVDYVLSLSGSEPQEIAHESGHENTTAQDHLAIGAQIFKQQCASCHGEDGTGLQEFGAPNLTDKIWLYGSDRATIYETVYYARAGMMPAWGERLDDNTLKQLTVYLHQLGGGESEITEAADFAPAPDEDLYHDAEPVSPEYEKTQEIEIGEEAIAPQPHAPVARNIEDGSAPSDDTPTLNTENDNGENSEEVTGSNE